MKKYLILVMILAATLLVALNIEGSVVDSEKKADKFCTSSVKSVPAINNRGSLLHDHFGVDPELESASGGNNDYTFNLESLVPEKHTETVTWVESDYYGGETEASTVSGTFPSGGEIYDVEALYMDNDNDNIYLAIITSFPHHRTINETVEIGYSDPNYDDIWVRPGDISLDLGLGTARVERHDSSWHYNYALDITHEDRDATTSYGSFPSCNMRDTELGSELYKTDYDATASANTINPIGLSDWHTSVRNYGAIAAYWEHTNFDPASESNITESSEDDPMISAGDASDGVITAYYELAFAENHEENGEKTYVIEATIPRILFGEDNPETGAEVGFRYTPGCRNDGESDIAIIKLTTTIKGFASIGDYVWYDLNQNGIQDFEEPGFGGITVNLYDDGDNPIKTTTSAVNGYYDFDNLLPGIYYVEFMPGDGEITLSYSDQDNDLNSDADQGTGQTETYTLIADQHETSVDCGFITGTPLPVTLISFTTLFTNGQARLQWATQSESNNALWNIYRAVSQNVGQSVKINYESLPGAGTTSEPTDYNYYDQTLNDFIDDQNLVNPTIYYWLESIDNGGYSELHGPVSLTVDNYSEGESTPDIPNVYGLNQNYPNPFNPDTGISFNLANEGKASLVIYNVKGEKVKTLFKDKNCSKNRNYIEYWGGKDSRGSNVSSGIYLAVLKTDKKLYTRKMILQK